MIVKKEEPKKLDYEYYELIIIVNSLKDKEYLSAIIDHVDFEYFKDANNREFIKNIFRFFVERGECPTLEELKSRLSSTEDKNSYKNVVTKILSQKLLNVEFNKEELYANTEKFLKDRGLYKTIDVAAEQHQLGVIDLDETLKSIEKIYAISLQESLGHWYFEDVEKHITDLTTTYHPIPTGWNSLDSRLEGGLFPKTLTCFIGQVNVGKSIVLGNLAANMTLKGKNVLLISLEMSEFMYSKRLSSQLSQIPHNTLKLYAEELKTAIKEVGNKLDSKLVVKEYPPKSITVRQIDAYISKLKHNGFKPDVVIIDYLNLINPSTKGLNSYESVKEIAEQLRALAFKYNIPFISASQLNRGGFNKDNPGMENISESIGLAATCDILCSIWQSDEDKELGILNMGMQKNRFGSNFGNWAFKVKYETLTMMETNKDCFSENSTDSVVSGASDTLTNLENLMEDIE